MRVYLTRDDLIDILALPKGHVLEAVETIGGDRRPGVLITVSGECLPAPGHGMGQLEGHVLAPLVTVRRKEYQALIQQSKQAPKPPVRLVPRGTDAPPEPPLPPPVPPGIKPPVTASDPDNWPKFPGEGLPYTQNDPGDEDIHTGGPR